MTNEQRWAKMKKHERAMACGAVCAHLWRRGQMTKKPIKIVHNAPKKKGKQEYRTFDTVEDAMEYVKKNMGRRLK